MLLFKAKLKQDLRKNVEWVSWIAIFLTFSNEKKKKTIRDKN